MGGLRLYKSRARVAASFWHVPKAGELAGLRARGLEVAEVRLDLAGVKTPEDAAALTKHFAAMPTIATMRSASEGGKWRGDDKTRHAIIRAALQYADAADIELVAKNTPEVAKTALTLGKTIIISRHNFARPDMPEMMEKIAEGLLLPEYEGVVMKIAGRVRNDKDLRTMEGFLHKWRRYPLVVIGIGESKSAILSRRMFPRQGSKLAFAAINKKSAPGQLTLLQTVAAVRNR